MNDNPDAAMPPLVPTEQPVIAAVEQTSAEGVASIDPTKAAFGAALDAVSNQPWAQEAGVGSPAESAEPTLVEEVAETADPGDLPDKVGKISDELAEAVDAEMRPDKEGLSPDLAAALEAAKTPQEVQTTSIQYENSDTETPTETTTTTESPVTNTPDTRIPAPEIQTQPTTPNTTTWRPLPQHTIPLKMNLSIRPRIR
jgi:hypothetical protein